MSKQSTKKINLGRWEVTLNFPDVAKASDYDDDPNKETYFLKISDPEPYSVSYTDDYVVALYGRTEGDGVSTNGTNYPVLKPGQEKALSVNGHIICNVKRKK